MAARQDHLPPRLVELFGELAARLSTADDDDRAVPLRTVEADGHVVVHRETDRRAIRDELCIDHARKRTRHVHVAAGQLQDDLLGRDPSHKRRELEVQAADRAAKLIGVCKTKYLWRQPGRIINTGHDK